MAALDLTRSGHSVQVCWRFNECCRLILSHKEGTEMAIENIGIAGAGLMGRGIASTLLGFGYHVVVYSPQQNEEELGSALAQIEQDCGDMVKHRVCTSNTLGNWRNRYRGTTSIETLSESNFIIETVIEDIAVKRRIYDQLEQRVEQSVTIASNSSAIPATIVQQGRKHPRRFLSMHWGIPAHNRFMEITPGEQTLPRCVTEATQIARRCKKDPAVLKKDIRGFIANRLMYALFREALSLLESGVADVEEIDRAFQNDIGSYATITGPFRLMDITGISAYAAVMKDLFPELSTDTHLPKTMSSLVDAGANGIHNGRGFYQYTPQQCEQWKRKWEEFGFDIWKLAEKHLPLE